MILAILKSLMFWKYRWITLSFNDGSRLAGVITSKSYEELKHSWFQKQSVKNG